MPPRASSRTTSSTNGGEHVIAVRTATSCRASRRSRLSPPPADRSADGSASRRRWTRTAPWTSGPGERDRRRDRLAQERRAHPDHVGVREEPVEEGRHVVQRLRSAELEKEDRAFGSQSPGRHGFSGAASRYASKGMARLRRKTRPSVGRADLVGGELDAARPRRRPRAARARARSARRSGWRSGSRSPTSRPRRGRGDCRSPCVGADPPGVRRIPRKVAAPATRRPPGRREARAGSARSGRRSIRSRSCRTR